MASRKRVKALENKHYALNGVSISGQVLTVWYDTTWTGLRPGKGSAIPKKQLTHVELRFEDKKWLKANNLHKNFSKIFVRKGDLEIYFEAF